MASRDELLVRLHDSELSVEEMEQLRAELTEEDQNKLSALAEVDTFLHDVLSQQADEHPLDLWAGIADKLPGTPAQAAKVLPLHRKVTYRVTAVASLVAVAAAMALWLRPVPQVSNRADIEELEVAGASATVIAVPDEHGDDTTLIWFDHQQEDEWESL